MNPQFDDIVNEFKKIFIEKYGDVIADVYKNSYQYTYRIINNTSIHITNSTFHGDKQLEGICIYYYGNLQSYNSKNNIVELSHNKTLDLDEINKIANKLLVILEDGKTFMYEFSVYSLFIENKNLKNQVNNLEKKIDRILLMLEFHPDNDDKINDLKDHFFELAK